jgi:hypothetical protein
LHAQVLTDPPACLLLGFGGAVKVSKPDESDDAIWQVLAFVQHEDVNDDIRPGGS